MTLTDTLKGTVTAEIDVDVTRVISGVLAGKDNYKLSKIVTLSDGSASGQATIALTGTVAATTGGITLSLADSVDPLSTGGDDVPSADPEGATIRAILIVNKDTANYVTLGLGTNAITAWIAGTTPTVRILAGAAFLQTFPAGGIVINDGVDDEIKLTGDTATVNCNILVLYAL